MAKTPTQLPTQKPRNFVAKNAIGSGAGAHKDKKKAFKQGQQKHKNKEYAESLAIALDKELKENDMLSFFKDLQKTNPRFSNIRIHGDPEHDELRKQDEIKRQQAIDARNAAYIQNIKTKYAGVDIQAEIDKLKPALQRAYQEYQYGSSNTWRAARDEYETIADEIKKLQQAGEIMSQSNGEVTEEFKDSRTPGRVKYEQMKEKIAGVLIKLYDKGNDLETIKQMGDRIAKHLGYDPADQTFQDAFITSFTDADLSGAFDNADDYTDYSMRQGEMGNPDRMREGKFNDKFGNKFNDILQKQHQPVAPKKAPTKDIDFEGWTIRTRSGPGKVDWAVLDRRGVMKNQGSEISMNNALNAAKSWIKAGADSTIAADSVTIDFNVEFAKEFAPDGETFFSNIIYGDNTPVLYFSVNPQKDLKRSSIRTQKDKITNGTTKLPAITLSKKEAIAAKLSANGRYVLGSQDKSGDDTYLFPLIYQSTVQGRGDMMRLNRPGLTVATSRETDESSISELSNNKLGQYKKAASADASAADKRGDFEKGNKRFKGIVKATNKQFANDKKSVSEANGDKVEAYGYQYNNRDQRIVWRKTFTNEAAAYMWADKRNATVIGVRPLDTNKPVGEGKWIKGPGGVPLDRQGNPKVAPSPKIKLARPPAPQKLTLDDVWRKVEDVVGQIYPDGDPIDWLAPWFKKQGIEDFKIGDILDKASRKHGYKDIYDYYRSFDELPTSMEENQEVSELDMSTMKNYLSKRKDSPTPPSLRKASKQAMGVRSAKEKVASKTTNSKLKSLGDPRIKESEGDAEGLEHLTPALAKHILEQIESEGVHAIVKSIEWGDGAAEELEELFKRALQSVAAKGVQEQFENYMESIATPKKSKKKFSEMELAIMEGGGDIGPNPLRKKKVNESYEDYLKSVLSSKIK